MGASTSDLQMVDGWAISVEQQHDVVHSWRATGTKLGSYHWATGIDKQQSLENMAAKIGINKTDVLSAFGLIQGAGS